MSHIKINLNTHDLMKPHVHGHHEKEIIVLHETVSPDINGMADILANENYLASIDYGLYACIDKQGYIAAARGLENAVFWTQGGENERGIGIELVSPIPALLEKGAITKEDAEGIWKARKIQLNRAAALCAALSHKFNIPLRYDHSCHPNKGICGHWNVSQLHPESEGHTDCWPLQEKGGYFPINFVIWRARYYKGQGVTF